MLATLCIAVVAALLWLQWAFIQGFDIDDRCDSNAAADAICQRFFLGFYIWVYSATAMVVTSVLIELRILAVPYTSLVLHMRERFLFWPRLIVLRAWRTRSSMH